MKLSVLGHPASLNFSRVRTRDACYRCEMGVLVILSRPAFLLSFISASSSTV